MIPNEDHLHDIYDQIGPQSANSPYAKTMMTGGWGPPEPPTMTIEEWRAKHPNLAKVLRVTVTNRHSNDH